MRTIDNTNQFSHHIEVIHTEDEAKLTLIVAFGSGLIGVGVSFLISRIGGNEKIRQHKEKRKIDIDYYKEKTEYDMKRKSSSPTSEDKNFKFRMLKIS